MRTYILIFCFLFISYGNLVAVAAEESDQYLVIKTPELAEQLWRMPSLKLNTLKCARAGQASLV